MREALSIEVATRWMLPKPKIELMKFNACLRFSDS